MARLQPTATANHCRVVGGASQPAADGSDLAARIANLPRMQKNSDKKSRFLEVGIWLLFFALLVPAGFVGWAIGHSTSSGAATKSAAMHVAR